MKHPKYIGRLPQDHCFRAFYLAMLCCVVPFCLPLYSVLAVMLFAQTGTMLYGILCLGYGLPLVLAALAAGQAVLGLYLHDGKRRLAICSFVLCGAGLLLSALAGRGMFCLLLAACGNLP